MLAIGLFSYTSCALGVGREEDDTGIFTMCVEIGDKIPMPFQLLDNLGGNVSKQRRAEMSVRYLKSAETTQDETARLNFSFSRGEAQRASIGRSPKTQSRQPLEGEWIMSQGSGQGVNVVKQDLVSSKDLSNNAKSNLTKLAAWISDRNIPFLVTSIGMIVMLLWAGSYKMTAPGAEGIIPLVSNSPLIWWHFRLFGPYVGSDIIGLTEIAAAILIIAGYIRPKAGIIGGCITTLMFFITSTMVITTPGTLIAVHGIRYMSFLGLFLFKDVISLGVSFYLISYFGKKATLSENEE